MNLWSMTSFKLFRLFIELLELEVGLF